MENQYKYCGMMSDISSELCQPLQTLKNEHGPLTVQMEKLYEASIKVGNDSSIDNWVEQIVDLKTNVVAFVQDLEFHSECEEDVLFPMMANYIGREIGPIAVMEYEHEQAKLHLKNFLEKTSDLYSEVNGEEAKGIANLVVQAYLILMEHFAKEENILFPMAEQMLSNEEKEELRKKIIVL